VEIRHKTGLKIVSNNPVICCVSFLFKRVSSAGCLLVSFTHDSRQPKTKSFLQTSLGKSLANEKTKEELAPCILIGQPKREHALRLLFFTSLLVN